MKSGNDANRILCKKSKRYSNNRKMRMESFYLDVPKFMKSSFTDILLSIIGFACEPRQYSASKDWNGKERIKIEKRA